MTDAEWLRERPEAMQIIDLIVCQLRLWSSTPIQEAAVREQYAEKLIALRAAIRADVVRELAGDAFDHTRPDTWPHLQTTGDVKQLLAAAHAQGRAAGREEAAKVAREIGVEFDTSKHITFRDGWRCASNSIETAIRSLP